MVETTSWLPDRLQELRYIIMTKGSYLPLLENLPLSPFCSFPLVPLHLLGLLGYIKRTLAPGPLYTLQTTWKSPPYSVFSSAGTSQGRLSMSITLAPDQFRHFSSLYLDQSLSIKNFGSCGPGHIYLSNSMMNMSLINGDFPKVESHLISIHFYLLALNTMKFKDFAWINYDWVCELDAIGKYNKIIAILLFVHQPWHGMARWFMRAQSSCARQSTQLSTN